MWIDIEQMGGSTLEAMAEAVENAALVLVCASEKYKMSPNCRTGAFRSLFTIFSLCFGIYLFLNLAEAEYTFQLKRPIVPLMMQRRYKPDGWLGMLMGAKKYINFDGKFEFEVAYSDLMREMQRHLTTDCSDGAGGDDFEIKLILYLPYSIF